MADDDQFDGGRADRAERDAAVEIVGFLTDLPEVAAGMLISFEESLPNQPSFTLLYNLPASKS